MPDDITAVIERIVEAAHIPSRRRRDELRRELHSHFDETGAVPEAVDAAMARFGNTAQIGDSFRKVYRRDYIVFYVAKVGACVAAATLVAILIEAIASLRLVGAVDDGYLSPRFAHAAAFGIVLALWVVAAAEAVRAPFVRSRVLLLWGGFAALSAGAWVLNGSIAAAFATAGILAMVGVWVVRNAATWPLRALLTLAVFATAEYLRHQSLGITFGPVRALTAGAVLLMLWASTMAIIAFADRAFYGAFKTT